MVDEDQARCMFSCVHHKTVSTVQKVGKLDIYALISISSGLTIAWERVGDIRLSAGYIPTCPSHLSQAQSILAVSQLVTEEITSLYDMLWHSRQYTKYDAITDTQRYATTIVLHIYGTVNDQQIIEKVTINHCKCILYVKISDIEYYFEDVAHDWQSSSDV